VTKNLWIDNLDLSLNRAATVTRELEKLGVPGDLVVAGGQGQYNPRAPNDTRENKAKNRRVEIVAIESRG
jgi:flagellar motor protein MotB